MNGTITTFNAVRNAFLDAWCIAADNLQREGREQRDAHKHTGTNFFEIDVPELRVR